MSTSPITVRVNPTVKLAQCCDNESSRYALAGVLVEPIIGIEETTIGTNVDQSPIVKTEPLNEVYAIATDSRCLAITRQPGLAVESAIMPGRFATPAKKTSKAKSVSLNGEWRCDETHRKNHTTESMSLPIVEGRFPRYQDVLPDPRAGKTVSVRLDARILAKLSEALTDDNEHKGIDLIFQCVESDGSTYIGDDAIMVAGINGIGAIMPLSRMEHSFRTPTATQAERNHHESLNRFVAFHESLRANANRLKTENTEERRAQVLALLNPSQETPAA